MKQLKRSIILCFVGTTIYDCGTASGASSSGVFYIILRYFRSGCCRNGDTGCKYYYVCSPDYGVACGVAGFTRRQSRRTNF